MVLIQRTYRMQCLNCGFSADARLNPSELASAEEQAELLCPICNMFAFVGEDYAQKVARERAKKR